MKNHSIALKVALLNAAILAIATQLYGDVLVFDTGARLDRQQGWSQKPPYPVVTEDFISAWSQPNCTGMGVGIGLYFDTNGYLWPCDSYLGVHDSWFVVNQGDVVDANLINTTTPFFCNYSPNYSKSLKFSIGDQFMLGIWIDADGSNNTSAGDCYGWVRLQRTGTTNLTLLGSGMSTSGVGIKAGTLETVPEPSTYALIGVALGVFALNRRRFFGARKSTAR